MKLGASEYFSTTQLEAIEKLGDIIVPANGAFPSFSDTGCIEHIDTVMAPAHEEDLKALGMLLLVLRYTPRLCIRWLLELMNRAEAMPRWLAPPFRLLNISLKGIVFSLYYSNLTRDSYLGPRPFDAIDYELYCEPDPQVTDK
ncbi:MAG: hypothetical protein R3208_14780 [Ketobacteraceae bacterium]|nr:hypothetical protein [Ketobacteraceae bacterium]